MGCRMKVMAVLCLVCAFMTQADVHHNHGYFVFQYGVNKIPLGKEPVLSEQQAADLLQHLTLAYQDISQIGQRQVWENLGQIYQGELQEEILFILYKTHFNWLFDRLRRVEGTSFSARDEQGRDTYISNGCTRYVWKGFMPISETYSTTMSSGPCTYNPREFRSHLNRVKPHFERPVRDFHNYLPAHRLQNKARVDALYHDVVRIFYHDFHPKLANMFANIFVNYASNKEAFAQHWNAHGLEVQPDLRTPDL